MAGRADQKGNHLSIFRIFLEPDHYLFEAVTGAIGWFVGHYFHDRKHPTAEFVDDLDNEAVRVCEHLLDRIERLEFEVTGKRPEVRKRWELP